MTTVSPQTAYERAQQGALLLDVRTPAEFRALHAAPAVAHELDAIQKGHLPEMGEAEGREVLVLCQTGKRATVAANLLAQQLPNPIHVVEGGTAAWVAAGLPHNKGASVMSLERQVRIAAGSLVLVGVILSVTVAPGFIWLSGFIGAGLIFAGVTDTCGMGLMLAKAPWNR